MNRMTDNPIHKHRIESGRKAAAPPSVATDEMAQAMVRAMFEHRPISPWEDVMKTIYKAAIDAATAAASET